MLIAKAAGRATTRSAARRRSAAPHLARRAGQLMAAWRARLASLDGSDACGIPVATLAIGRAGAVNAALLAAAILARSDEELLGRLRRYRKEQAQSVLDVGDPSS